MRTITTLVAVLALTLTADAKPRKHKPTTEHVDTSEVDAAKQALTVARLKAKVAKAKARAAKAVLACEQAVSDLCVETASPDGSSDCEAPALFAACH